MSIQGIANLMPVKKAPKELKEEAATTTQSGERQSFDYVPYIPNNSSDSFDSLDLSIASGICFSDW